jgi:hypothetical protein
MKRRISTMVNWLSNILRWSLAAAMFGGAVAGYSVAASAQTTAAKPKPALVQATDLFRPHADPDDHWDLACAFALARQGSVDLRAVLIDYPPPNFDGDPDVQAVAQLNFLTGSAVPAIVAPPKDAPAALLELLRKSTLPVAVSMVGSTRNVASAAQRDPRLFAEKCAAIYMCAGSGTPDKSLAARLEYNVALDPGSYAAIFKIPCPVYWLPCFEVEPEGNDKPFIAGPHGSYYRFLQKDVLPGLSPRLQNYFAYLYRGRAGNGSNPALWLRALEGPREEAVLADQGKLYRNMWSTAGLLHAAGLTVTVDGNIVPLGSTKTPAYAFEPVRVECGADGVTAWTPDPQSRNRFLFRVRDEKRYPAAMTAALRTLLRNIP